MKRWLAVLGLLSMLGGPVYGVEGSRLSDLAAFQPLFDTRAASDKAYIPHPGCILVRKGDQVRATIKGHFPEGFVLPPGATLVLRHGPYLEVWASQSALVSLAVLPETEALYPPLRFQSTVETEARGALSMQSFDQAGDEGQGVRVAVVDLDFTGHDALLGTELPADTYFKSFLNSGVSSSASGHGTAVAEIIHDVAPKAQLYLLEIAETADFVQAVDWCIDNNINVVNMSLAFIAGPRDGTGYQAEQINRAAKAGIIWVCAAGNEAGTHWQGNWQDADQDGVMEVGPGREVIGFNYAGQSGGFPQLLAQMVWDLWPSTSGLSFDLVFYRDSLRTVQLSSSNGFPGLSQAYRLAVLDNPTPGRYYVAVVYRFGTIPPGLHFDVYLDANLAQQVSPLDPSGSLVSPADAEGAVAVGAYDYGVTTPGANPIHSYSSQGPTWDGRIKPDIVAGSGVSTYTYGTKNFYGTSASSPHVAGVAAVLSSATVRGALFNYSWSVGDFLRLLSVNSIDFGPAGPDNIYGRGGLRMPPASPSPLSLRVSSHPNPFNSRVDVAFAARPGERFHLAVFDLLGRLVWQTEGMHTSGPEERVNWCGCDDRGHPLPSGVYFYRVETDFETGLGRAVLLK